MDYGAELVFEDRLHCLNRFDPIPAGSAYNDTDPFSPYFYCPYEMGMNYVYRDAVILLEDFDTRDVQEIRELLKQAFKTGRDKLEEHLKSLFPTRPTEDHSLAAKHAYEIQKTNLLRQFPPEDHILKSNKIASEAHFWGVYAIEELAKSLELLNLPIHPRAKKDLKKSPYIEDALGLNLKLTALSRMTEHSRLNSAIHRQRSCILEAARHVTSAAQHLQYAMLIIFSKMNDEKNAAARLLQEKKLSGLLRINNLKTSAIERAQAIASERWSAEGPEKTLIASMANQVWSVLIDEGFSDSLPDTSARIKDWIRPIAPASASRRGRPKK